MEKGQAKLSALVILLVAASSLTISQAAEGGGVCIPEQCESGYRPIFKDGKCICVPSERQVFLSGAICIPEMCDTRSHLVFRNGKCICVPLEHRLSGVW
ncbi:hypothetical protein ACJRO7_019381 [Eucalyptus globulus]|uniref:Uncharacterized protein n=1 Tax=Eucalyptus globulus TaxID=34317 RepID=A0ABD3KI88_EUCGL